MNASTLNRLKKAMWLVGAFGVCFIIEAGIWWGDSYLESLDAGFHWETLPLIAGAAFVLTWICGVEILPSGLVVGCTFPVIYFGRVVLDCIEDPTRDNLWPFAVGMALIIGMMTAFPPAAIGWLLRRITHRSRGDRAEPR